MRNVAQMEAEQNLEPIRPVLVASTDAARILGTGRTTVYQLVNDGHLTPIHVRRCVRFSVYEIEQYVESLRRAT